MDWLSSTAPWIIDAARSPRIRGVAVLALIAVGLVTLQLWNTTHRQPQMCELISGCHLRHGDLQRIQVALGESGLSGHRIEDRTLFVPRSEHAAYLKAVSDRNALPMDLKADSLSNAAINPLLSRSQQQSLEREHKKRQVREMILRLPFVEQAWLEMDASKSNSPFHQDEQSAVVSIRPLESNWLTEQQVDTIRRMIGGAVAGLSPQAIEVIDLSEGIAKQRTNDTGSDRHAAIVQHRADQQRELKSRILTALQAYEGVEVHVQLSPCTLPANVLGKHGVAERAASVPAKLTAGSNGVASIYKTRSVTAVPVKPVGFTRPSSDHLADGGICRATVQIEVPEAALRNVAMSLMLRPSLDASERHEDNIARKFAAIKPQIQREVSSLLPVAWRKHSGPVPVQVTLRRSEIATTTNPIDQALVLAQQHWPSIATLAIGLVLLSIVVRKPTEEPAEVATATAASILPMSLAESEVATNDAKQLNQMVQEHPDETARALEGWIRNAG